MPVVKDDGHGTQIGKPFASRLTPRQPGWSGRHCRCCCTRSTLCGIVRSALLLLCHHRSTVSASSMESLRCLRGRIRLLRWMEHDRCRSRMRSTTFGRAICLTAVESQAVGTSPQPCSQSGHWTASMVVRVLKCCRRLGRLHLGRSHDGGSGRKNDGHSSSGPCEGGRPAKIVEFLRNARNAPGFWKLTYS